jgi:hypothetical protein
VIKGVLVAFSKVPTIMSKIFTSNVRQLAVASGLALLASSSAFAQQSATATANANATIIIPISITKTVDLQFGKLAVGATGGTVTIGTNDAVTIGGASHTISQPPQSLAGTPPTAASFTVNGEGSFTYAVTLPSSATLTSGGNTMTVGSFVSNPSSPGTLSSGTQVLKVGATLTVSDGQAPGSYGGTFDVTVAYN